MKGQPMVPIDKTTEVRYGNFNRPGAELWKVASADGVWVFERIEITGTPWDVYHVESGRCVGMFGTISAARRGLYAALEAGRVCPACGGGHSYRLDDVEPCTCPGNER